MGIVIAIVVALVLLPLFSVVVMYNRFVRQRTLIDASWGGVDVELTRRHDLIPNLVSTVQGYAAHEASVLTSLTAAREAAAAHKADAPGSRQVLEEQVTQQLATVLVRAEAYPELKASANFLQLQHELTNTEDRIAAARRFYNLNVGAYNTRVATIPSNIVASIWDFEPRDFFEITDAAVRQVPRVAP